MINLRYVIDRSESKLIGSSRLIAYLYGVIITGIH